MTSASVWTLDRQVTRRTISNIYRLSQYSGMRNINVYGTEEMRDPEIPALLETYSEKFLFRGLGDKLDMESEGKLTMSSNF